MGPRRPARVSIAVCAALTALTFAGCVGSTGFPSDFTETSATLRASGYSDDGPMTWWWEYDTVRSELGTADDTEVCGDPPQADRRCGPATFGSPGNHVSTSVGVTGLAPGTTYFYRACGQDTNDSGPTCAQTLTFSTAAEKVEIATVGRLTAGGEAVTLPARFRCPRGDSSYFYLSNVDQAQTYGTDLNTPFTTCTGTEQTATITVFHYSGGPDFEPGPATFTGCFVHGQEGGRTLGPIQVQLQRELPPSTTFRYAQRDGTGCVE